MSENDEWQGDERRSTIVNYSNSAQFETIKNTETLAFFYTESSDGEDVTFDPRGDEALFNMLAESPYDFDNNKDLIRYESLVTRAMYECKLHPNQAAAEELAASSLTPEEAGELLFFVYRRDRAAISLVQNRRQSPFDALNVDNAPEIILFRRYSFEPMMLVTPVWRDETRINATVGVFGVLVKQMFYD